MKENIRERILEATLELADEKGLGRVSMSQIAERVGLKKSSIYSHYASKEEIIEKMYTYFRGKASTGTGPVDYGAMVEGRSMNEVLNSAVNGYRAMNSDPMLARFYRVIVQERAMNKTAAEIMLAESEKMILATKQLFYAMQAKGIARFRDPDMAAFTFAMGIHAVLDLINDAQGAGSEKYNDMTDRYVEEFCAAYGREV